MIRKARPIDIASMMLRRKGVRLFMWADKKVEIAVAVLKGFRWEVWSGISGPLQTVIPDKLRLHQYSLLNYRLMT